MKTQFSSIILILIFSVGCGLTDRFKAAPIFDSNVAAILTATAAPRVARAKN